MDRKNKKIKSAWVIYLTDDCSNTTVLSVLSSRHKDKEVAQKLEYLYALIYYDLDEHLDYYGKYYPLSPPYEARGSSCYDESKDCRIWYPIITCGHNPYLVAGLGSQIERLIDENNNKILKWKSPNRVRFNRENEKTLEYIGKYNQAVFKSFSLGSIQYGTSES